MPNGTPVLRTWFKWQSSLAANGSVARVNQGWFSGGSMERTVGRWIWAGTLAGLLTTGVVWADVAKDQYAVAAGH